MTLVLNYVARSDRGLVRSNNQDSVYAGPRLLAVADGMGGHAAGEVASKIVIAALAPLDDDEPGEDLLSELRGAVHAGNSAISELVAHDPELEGMGTTLTAILFAGNRIGLVNIGDSRTYLMRNGSVSQITHDDTFVQSLIDEGRITPEEANSHPQRSLLLRALTGHEVEPTLTVREARSGDRYLLCSDGLSGVISDETLAEAIRIADPKSCADRMIELALRGGGPDNVTVIVADVVDIDFGEDAPIVGGAAGDGTESDPPPADSPASRASALNPAPPPPRVSPALEAPPVKRKRRWLRALVATVIVLVVLAGAAFGTYWAVLRQYYVGVADSGEIAIFEGVPYSVLGIQLHRQVEGSCPPGTAGCQPITVNDLNQAGRVTVQSDITHLQSMQQARSIIQGLRTNQVLPECPKPNSTSASGSSTSSTSTTSGAPGSHPSTGHPAGATTTIPLVGSDHGNGQATVTPDVPVGTLAPTGTSAPEPGVNCRKAGG